jgi:hypothetical protein
MVGTTKKSTGLGREREREREKVCDISAIWLWGIVMPRFEILHRHFTSVANQTVHETPAII